MNLHINYFIQFLNVRAELTGEYDSKTVSEKSYEISVKNMLNNNISIYYVTSYITESPYSPT